MEFGPFVDEEEEDTSNYPTLSALAQEKPADWQEAFEGKFSAFRGPYTVLLFPDLLLIS